MVQKSDQPCRFYIIDGSCKYGSDCLFSHGLDLFGRIEMQIRALLHMPYVSQVPVEVLPWIRPELGILFRQVGWDGTLDHLTSLLGLLHTICVVYDRCLMFQNSYGCYAILLENASRYLGYFPYNPNVMDADSEAHQIYINFSAQSREICTEENVCHYFSHYGPVLSVKIPRERSYGFVRFWYPETVRLLLSNWNYHVPHFIFGAALYVDPYISCNRRNPAVNHGPNDPDGGLEHMPNAPAGVAGQVPGVPDEVLGVPDAAQQDMNPAGNHGRNGPNGGPGHVPNALGVVPGQVPGVPDEVPDVPAGGLGHVPNAPGAVPDEVLGVLDGDAAEQDMNPAGNHVPNGPNGGPGHVPNALGVVPGQVPGVPDEVPDVPAGDAAQQDMDGIAAALPDGNCFY